MKAWTIDSLSGLSALRMREVVAPLPKPGEVLLDILYAGLNPADRYLSEGLYPARPTFPHILGRDGVGIVSAVGENVRGVKIGDKRLLLRTDVGVSTWGTFAEKTAIPVASLTVVPPGWSDQEAAGAPLVYITAYQALTQWGEIPSSSAAAPPVVLITGASGGVGVASVQLAKALGYTVIALSRSEEKRSRLYALGADLVLDPADSQWRRHSKDYLDATQRKVDLVIENIGGALFTELLDTLGMNGRVSVVGRLAGPVPSFNTAALFFRRLRIGGVAIGTYTITETQQAWTAVLQLLNRNSARPLVDSVHAFEHLPAAFDKLAAGPMGKVLLAVNAA